MSNSRARSVGHILRAPRRPSAARAEQSMVLKAKLAPSACAPYLIEQPVTLVPEK
jgi:hypothetical protein